VLEEYLAQVAGATEEYLSRTPDSDLNTARETVSRRRPPRR